MNQSRFGPRVDENVLLTRLRTPRAGGKVIRERHPTHDASAVLRGMVLDRVITNFATNFETVRRSGAPPDILVWIKGEDDLSLAHVAIQILETFRPILGDFRLTVESDPWIPRSRPSLNPSGAGRA